MSTITIKNLPMELHRDLKDRAKTNGRSLNREIIATIVDTLHVSPIDASAIRDRARTVRESMGVYLTQRDLTKHKAVGRR